MISARHLRTVQLGIKSLLLHKMRSALTMLGIIFGVCSVIAMLAIGEGASYEAQQAIKKLGSATTFIIRSVKASRGQQEQPVRRAAAVTSVEYGLTYKDAVAAFRQTVPGVKRVLPMRIIRDSMRVSASIAVSRGRSSARTPIYPEIAGMDSYPRSISSRALDETLGAEQCLRHYRRSWPSGSVPLSGSPSSEDTSASGLGLLLRRRHGAGDQFRAKSVPQIWRQAPVPARRIDSNIYIPLSRRCAVVSVRLIIRRSAGTFEAERVELHQITLQMRGH